MTNIIIRLKTVYWVLLIKKEFKFFVVYAMKKNQDFANNIKNTMYGMDTTTKR